MDKIAAVIVGSLSSIGLVRDYFNRKEFNDLVNKRTSSDGYSYFNDSLYSDESLHHDLIAEKIVTEDRKYHTNKNPQIIGQFGETKFLNPETDVYKDWSIENISTTFAPRIRASNQNGIVLFPKDADICWDDHDKKIDAGKRISTFAIHSYTKHSFFGKKEHDEFFVKFFGDEKFVLDKVKSDHFRISNLDTGMMLTGVVLSLAYLYHNNKKD